jgi:hypothetical protein
MRRLKFLAGITKHVIRSKGRDQTEVGPTGLFRGLRWYPPPPPSTGLALRNVGSLVLNLLLRKNSRKTKIYNY